MRSASLLPALSCVMSAREDELLNAYDEWLYYERKLLHIERWGRELHEQTLGLIPASHARDFHFPLWPARWAGSAAAVDAGEARPGDDWVHMEARRRWLSALLSLSSTSPTR